MRALSRNVAWNPRRIAFIDRSVHIHAAFPTTLTRTILSLNDLTGTDGERSSLIASYDLSTSRNGYA